MTWIVSDDNNVVKIRIVEKDPNSNRLTVFSILSPEDEARSFWGQITYSIHKSRIHGTYEGAKKAAFINRLS